MVTIGPPSSSATMVELKWKKRLSYFAIGMYFFMGGVEYAVILPTMWLYISTQFGAEEYILGVLLSCYSIAAIVAGPLLGRWTDKTNHPKIIMVFGTLWEVAGSIMYFMGISVWFLIGSRLVCGVGGGVEAVIMAVVSKTTEEEKRTGIISILIAVRQSGLLIGPGLNLFLREMNFYVGTFHVNKYNVPGAFMAIMWIVQMFILIFCYSDLHLLQNTNVKDISIVKDSQSKHVRDETVSQPTLQDKEEENKQHLPVNQSVIDGRPISPDDLMETAESVIAPTQSRRSTSPDGADTNGYAAIETDYTAIESSLREDRARSASQEYINSTEEALVDYLAGKSKLKFMYDEYVREEVITVIAVQFNSFFNQLALETMATPLSNTLMNWGELENSLMYCGAGVEIIAVFILIRYLSRKLSDRTLLVIGTVTMAAALAWLTYIVPISPPHSPQENMPRFLVGVFLDMFALPFLAATSISLYSKITRKETQGLSMGIRRSVVGMATILAPLWAGSTIQMPYLMFGVMLGLIVISLIMLFLSYGKLNPTSQQQSVRPVNTEDDERRPLLS